jgi:hypothetical protein
MEPPIPVNTFNNIFLTNTNIGYIAITQRDTISPKIRFLYNDKEDFIFFFETSVSHPVDEYFNVGS